MAIAPCWYAVGDQCPPNSSVTVAVGDAGDPPGSPAGGLVPDGRRTATPGPDPTAWRRTRPRAAWATGAAPSGNRPRGAALPRPGPAAPSTGTPHGRFEHVADPRGLLVPRSTRIAARSSKGPNGPALTSSTHAARQRPHPMTGSGPRSGPRVVPLTSTAPDDRPPSPVTRWTSPWQRRSGPPSRSTPRSTASSPRRAARDHDPSGFQGPGHRHRAPRPNS